MKIVLTGGGTAGHVTPNLALLTYLKSLNWECIYIGSTNGIEADLVQRTSIPFRSIVTGKLRREFNLKNLLTPFKVLIGICQSLFLLNQLKPDVIFSKGGFVSFPVVLAGWCLRIPVVAHESDFSPGLANRMSHPFIKKICVTFEKSQDFFKKNNNTVVTGNPVRKNLLAGDSDKARALCDFDQDKPVLMLMGGSLGSVLLNKTLRQSLDQLLATFNIIHICGKGNIDDTIKKNGYSQFEYLHETMADCLALADIIVSRAGANAIYELLCLEKPMLLIPLSKKISRGDQIENANYFSEKGYALILEEENLNESCFIENIQHLWTEKDFFKKNMGSVDSLGSGERIITVLQAVVN